MSDSILIIGGGLAAQRAGETLRRAGHDGPVTIVCAEPHRPYDRPPLSKEVLTGHNEPEQVFFRAPDWYRDEDLELVTGTAATRLHRSERRVELEDGSELAYDKLLIATGSRPRTLPAFERFENVSVLRTLDDSLQLNEALRGASRIVVIGAGFIGQEVAAGARKLGVEVTMVEAAPSILGHMLGEQVGGWFADLHRSHGVDVVLGHQVQDVVGNGHVQALSLSDGSTVEVDHVVVGIGVAPDTEWLLGTGLIGIGLAGGAPAGVEVGDAGRTLDANIFAAGDAAATYDPVLGRHMPGSHWEAAARQGARAARAMLGLDPGIAPVSSFWTDQYGLRVQYLGRAPLADETAIDGSPEERDFTVIYRRAGRPVAALLVNRPGALPEVRRLLETGSELALSA
jgi:3-phenylpropionate/trans-cinnamate dioxygenase ferredoxin reductase subunit